MRRISSWKLLNTLLPTLTKTLHRNVVKFSVSTSEHSTKSLFQCVVITKWRPRSLSFTRPIGYYVWAVGRVGKNSVSLFCDCFTCVPPGVRPCTVVKEKDVFHVPVRAYSTESKFKCLNRAPCLIRASLWLLSAVTAVAGRPFRDLSSSDLCLTTLKMPDPNAKTPVLSFSQQVTSLGFHQLKYNFILSMLL
jgi:hypothetical protein